MQIARRVQMTKNKGERPRNEHSHRFKNFDKTPKKIHFCIKCRRCLAAHRKDRSQPSPRAYKSNIKTMRNHKCPKRFEAVRVSPLQDMLMHEEPFQTPVAQQVSRQRSLSAVKTTARTPLIKTLVHTPIRSAANRPLVFRTPVTEADCLRPPVHRTPVHGSVGVPPVYSPLSQTQVRQQVTSPVRMPRTPSSWAVPPPSAAARFPSD